MHRFVVACWVLVSFLSLPVMAIEYTPEEERWSDFLPIWGKQAKAQGYTLPRPFGISIGRTDIAIPLNVDGTNVTLGGNSIARLEQDAVTMDDITGANHSLRADVWLFPFLNVYGFVGDTRGEVDVTFDLPEDLVPQVLNGLGVGPFTQGVINFVTAPLQNEVTLTRKFKFRGLTGGAGFTLAGGYKQMFAVADYNVSRSEIDLLDGSAFSKVWSYRIGWNGHIKGKSARLWGGWMTHDLTQVTSVKLSGLNLPLLADVKIDLQVSDSEGKTPLAGFSYELNDSWAFIVDARFGKRKLLNSLLEYRF